MEPITMTLVAAVTLAASTHRPKWEEQLQVEQPPTVFFMPKQEATSVPLIDRRATGLAVSKAANSVKDKLFQELMTFIPVGDEDPSMEPVSAVEDVLAANEFLRKLPGSISLPTLMRNDSGDIGMYWDNDAVYIDVDIETSSTVSLYVRNLATNEQSIVEDVSIDQISTDWFEANIGKLLKPVTSAA